MLKDFYKQNRVEITSSVRTYLEEALFAENSKLKQDIIAVISGSIASGHYDQYSDIDLDLYCKDESSVEQYKDVILRLKKRISNEAETPIQIHRLKSLGATEKELAGHQNDNALRETACSLIVTDPDGDFSALQQRFKWYPDDVAEQKLQWLYAQLIFEHEEHFKIAAERSDAYYLEVAKLSILRLAGNAILLANKRWPAFDKHLVASLADAGIDAQLIGMFNKVLAENKNVTSLINELVVAIEHYLIAGDYIPKEPIKYWIDLRPAYSVSLG
jgi:predicted nucleotidyltransferase